MSIEKLLADVVEALNNNTAALEAAAGKASTASTDKPGKGKATSVSVEDMQAALTEVSGKFGSTAAKKIIKDVGGVAKMAEIPEKKFAAVFEAAKKALEGDGDAEEI